MEAKDILFKFQLPIERFNSDYHDITSKIRIYNGMLINHDKVNQYILFEIQFQSYRDLSEFQKNLNFTLDKIS